MENTDAFCKRGSYNFAKGRRVQKYGHASIPMNKCQLINSYFITLCPQLFLSWLSVAEHDTGGEVQDNKMQICS